MFEHKYDESGLATSYVTLTLLIIGILYMLYRLTNKKQGFVCNCKKCIENKKEEGRPNINALVALSMLILLSSVMIRNIFTLKMKEEVAAYNPYVVLGVDEFTKSKIVKKKYKKLLKKLFIKAKNEDEEEEAQKEILEINKAYELVKNPENYQKFLKSEIKQEQFVALPQFILKFSKTSFVCYMILLSVAIPIVIFIFRSKTKKKTNRGIFYSTAEGFYEVADKIKTDNKSYLMMELIAMLSETEDLKMIKYKKDLTDESDFYLTLIKKYLKVDLNSYEFTKNNSFLYIIDILFRQNKGDSANRNEVQEKSLILIKTLFIISQKKNTQLLSAIINLERIFIQCVPSETFELFQLLPLNGTDEVLDNVENKKNAEIAYCELLNEKDRYDAFRLQQKLPQIKIDNLRAFEYDEFKIAERAEDIEKVELEGEKTFHVHKSVNSYLSFSPVIKYDEKNVHAPFCATEQQFVCVMIVKLNRMVKEVRNISPSTGEIKILLPNSNGTVRVDVYIKPAGYLGCDVEENIKIKFK